MIKLQKTLTAVNKIHRAVEGTKDIAQPNADSSHPRKYDSIRNMYISFDAKLSVKQFLVKISMVEFNIYDFFAFIRFLPTEIYSWKLKGLNSYFSLIQNKVSVFSPTPRSWLYGSFI